MWRQECLTFRTTTRTELLDITAQVERVLADGSPPQGLCTVYSPHTTGAIAIQEHADPDVARDMLMAINKVIPFEDGYRHASGNAAAHIKAALVGASETIPVRDGRLQLGRWQGVFFCEFDGPRARQVLVTLVGDSPG